MYVRLSEVDDVLHNPWMGWGLWAGPVSGLGKRFSLEDSTTGFGDDAPLFDWVCLDWMWADLEPQEGQFHWDKLDHVMRYWVDRGKQINLRLWVTDDPGWSGRSGASEVCPNWLWEAGAPYHEYVDEGGREVKEPDYAHPSYLSVYLPRLRAFLQAVADRYDRPGNPFNLVGCMGYGQWGEWHTLWSRYVWPDKETKHDVLSRIVRTYAEVFRHSQLSVSYAPDTFNFGQVRYPGRGKEYWKALARDDVEDFKYCQALDVALASGFALARHGFIDGLHRPDKMLMQQQWRRTALYAEGDWSYADVRRDGTHGTLNENIDVMCEWHSNYGHFYMDCHSYRQFVEDEDGRMSFERGLRAGGLGYRLVLTEASWPDTIAPGQMLLLRQKWVNRNVGRLYRPHLLKVYLFDSSGREICSAVDWAFDCTGWVRGQEYEVISAFYEAMRTETEASIMVPPDVKPGEYEIRIALVDIESQAPQIRLAIAGDDGQKRYRIGKIRVV